MVNIRQRRHIALEGGEAEGGRVAEKARERSEKETDGRRGFVRQRDKGTEKEEKKILRDRERY